MSELFKLSLLVVAFLFGLLCTNSPHAVSEIIVRWTKFASGERLENDYVQKASDLIENNPEEYRKQYAAHLATIQRTGYIAIIVSLIGICLALMPS
jgi:CHASE3 domain sensor protein